MIIHPPEIAYQNNTAEISARVSYKKQAKGRPERLWFRYPEQYFHAVSSRSDPFVVGALLVAMALDEPVHVEGITSPRLAYGLEEYQKACHAWAPEKFQQIELRFEQLSALTARPEPGAVVSAFSGGIDFSFTLMTHLPQSQKQASAQITHGLFIHGFDIPLQDKDDYRLARQVFEVELDKLNIHLIPCSTNLHYFSNGIVKWNYFHGLLQVGAALALDRMIRIYYIPSSYTLQKPKPLEAWPYLYNLLSTETLTVYHDGVPYSRFEKTAALTGWQPAKNFLRVCVNRQKRFGVRNCSTCEKCRRTLTMIKLTGKTEDFKTFRQPYRWFDLLRWFSMYDDAVPIWIKQMTRHAWVSRQYVVLPLLLFSHLCGLARFWLYQCIPGNIYHQLKSLFFPPEKDPFNPCHLTPDQQ